MCVLLHGALPVTVEVDLDPLESGHISKIWAELVLLPATMDSLPPHSLFQLYLLNAGSTLY